MRRPLAVLIALLLAAGLTACGSSDGKTSPSASGSKSAASSAEAAAQTGQALFDDMTTAMAEAGTGSVEFRTAIGTEQFSGGGVFRLDESDFGADMTITMAGLGKVRGILLPDAFYLKFPKSAGAPAGKPWVRIDGSGGKGDPMTKAFGPLMDQVQEQFDPKSNMSVLKAITKLTKAGTETIDGIETTKYTATVDLAKAAQVSTGVLADQYRGLVKEGVKTMTYSTWVDDETLPHKFSTVIPTPQGDVSTTGIYHDWGKPVSIKAPPKSQVTSAGKLAGSSPGASALAG